MNLPTTIEDVAELLGALIPDNSGVTVDSIVVTPWGVHAGFNVEGVAIDPSEIVFQAQVETVSLGEEDFVITDAIRLEFEACDEEDEETPAGIVVGTHSSAESGDESHCASIYGDLFLLAEGGDEDAWRAAAAKDQDDMMRKQVESSVSDLLKLIEQSSDAAMKGIGRRPPVRDLMRRLAAAA